MDMAQQLNAARKVVNRAHATFHDDDTDLTDLQLTALAESMAILYVQGDTDDEVSAIRVAFHAIAFLLFTARFSKADEFYALAKTFAQHNKTDLTTRPSFIEGHA